MLFLFFYIYSPFYRKKLFGVVLCITIIMPILAIVFLLHNKVDGGLFYQSVGIDSEVPGIGFNMLSWFSYVITIAGMILGGVKIFHPKNKQDVKKKIAVLLGIFAPLIINVIKIVILPLININLKYDPTAISMSIAAVLFMYGIFGLNMLNILPAAMRDLFEQMNEGVIVLARDLVILKTNRFIKNIFDGRTFEGEVIQNMLEIIKTGDFNEEGMDKIKGYFTKNERILENTKVNYIKSTGERFIFYINISWITDKRDRKLGYLMIIHEYTQIALLQEEIHAQSLKLKETFEKLNPGVSEIITKGEMQLGEVCATNYFCDVVGYTIINMIMGDRLTSLIMNEFLSKSHIITTMYHGYRDKINGDQIITIYGIKKDECQESKIHPFDAIFSALKIKELTANISAKFPEYIESEKSKIMKNLEAYRKNTGTDIPMEDFKFSLRHGISTSKLNPEQEIDRLSMTMVGDESGFDYTCQGGAVILAARLESREESVNILISEETYSWVSNLIHAEKMPPLYLKNLGKYSYYTLVGLKTLTDDYFPQLVIEIAQPWNKKIMKIRKKIKIGATYFYEISKIVDKVAIDLEYMEHLKGTMNIGTFRAFWALSFAHLLKMPIEPLVYIALLDPIHYREFPSLNIKVKYNIEKQLPADIDYQRILSILHYSNKKKKTDYPGEIRRECEIIRFSRLLDSSSFDHTYLREFKKDIRPLDEAATMILNSEEWLPEIRETIAKLLNHS